MPYYSDELIDEVQRQNDIVDVVGSYVRLTKKGSTYFGLCPFHNEKTGSFSVSPAKQMFYCFGCGAGGNVFTFLMKYENLTFKEAMQTLADKAGIQLPQREMTAKERQEADYKTRLLEINKEAAKYFYSLLRGKRGERAYAYFHETRGLSEETMQKFGLGYSDQYSDDLYRYLSSKGYDDQILKESGLVSFHEKRGGYDKFWNRAMFPIMDANSHVIGFGGRVMGEGDPKYLNSPETKVFDKSRNLYGLNIARHSRKDYLLLCEGYVDVISLHQAGFDNAVASLGTALTEGHASVLKRYTKEVYLTYDSDGAGVKAAIRAVPILKKYGIETKVINMRPHKDPDEFIKALGAEEYQRRIEQAENGFLFTVRMLEQRYNLKDPQGKTSFLNEIAQRMLIFHEQLERENYMEVIANQYHISMESFKKTINETALKNEGMAAAKAEYRTITKDIKKKEDGMKKSQELLLTWLSERQDLYANIKNLVRADDFTEGVCQEVARLLFEQLEEGTPVNVASIINHFQNEEEHSEVAGMFNRSIPKVETEGDMSKAVKETIVKIKRNSIEYKSKNLDPADMAGMMQLINDKTALEKLEKSLGLA